MRPWSLPGTNRLRFALHGGQRAPGISRWLFRQLVGTVLLQAPGRLCFTQTGSGIGGEQTGSGIGCQDMPGVGLVRTFAVCFVPFGIRCWLVETGRCEKVLESGRLLKIRGGYSRLKVTTRAPMGSLFRKTP